MALQFLNIDQRTVLKANTTFRTYLVERILGAATYGCAYYLGLADFATADIAKRRIVSAEIEKNQNIITGDADLVQLMFLKMISRGLDKYDDADDYTSPEQLTDNVITQLDLDSKFQYLVSDYFDEKTPSKIF